MASWSKRRRFTYAGVLVALLIVAVGIPAFLFFYKAPTCFDGRKNGSEQDVDCGGACTKLCPSAFLPLAVTWTRFEEVAPHIYNVAAYVVNPNPKVHAIDTPYLMTLYDAKAVPISEISGKVFIPAGHNTIAFKASVNTGIQIPVRASMKFTGVPNWAYETRQAPELITVDQKYSELASSSALTVTLRNKGNETATGISVYVILEDVNGNAIGFSKTIIDEMTPGASATAPFTWPFSRNGKVVSIEVIPVAE